MEDKESLRKKHRIDMVLKNFQVIDEEKGLLKVLLVPDPRVWEKRTINDKKGFWHTLDHIFLSEGELKKAAPTLAGKPITVENIGMRKDEYLRRSKERIGKRKS